MASRSDILNEDWLKVRTWDIWLGPQLVSTLDQLRQYCDRQDISLDHFLSLPAAAAMPEPLRTEAAMYRQQTIADQLDPADEGKDGVLGVLDEAMEAKLFGAAAIIAARHARERGDQIPRVRTEGGRRKYKRPIGTPITPHPDYSHLAPTEDATRDRQRAFEAARRAAADYSPDPRYLEAADRVVTRQQEELAAGRDTPTLFDHLNGVRGKYTAERERDQRRVVGHFLDRPGSIPPKGQAPLLLMVGGVPGAGKTTTINSEDGQRTLGIHLDNFVILNPDDVKVEMARRGMVPDYPGLTADEAATLYHQESSDIVRLISARAMAQGRNVLWDSSMRNEEQAARLMAHVTDDPNHPPYDIWMMLVDTPLPVAKERAVKRYMGGGRFIPLAFIDRLADKQWGTKPRRAFESLKHNPDVKRWFRFSNDGPTPQILESSGA